jgi:hypothetical protein
MHIIRVNPQNPLNPRSLACEEQGEHGFNGLNGFVFRIDKNPDQWYTDLTDD